MNNSKAKQQHSETLNFKDAFAASNLSIVAELFERKQYPSRGGEITESDVRIALHLASAATDLAIWLEKQRLLQACPGLTRCYFPDVNWSKDPDEGTYSPDIERFSVTRKVVDPETGELNEFTVILDDPDWSTLTNENDISWLIGFAGLSSDSVKDIYNQSKDDEEAHAKIADKVANLVSYQDLKSLITVVMGQQANEPEILFGC